jgi:hypothetical protein
VDYGDGVGEADDAAEGDAALVAGAAEPLTVTCPFMPSWMVQWYA